jgi:O-antigen/teichoic acid export membrane protein
MEDDVFKKFTKSVAVSASTQVFLRLQGLILMPIITKRLGAANYGIWSQVNVLVGLLQPVATMGLSNGLFRYLPGKEKPLVRREYYSIISIVFVSTLLWCVLIYLFSKNIAVLFFEKSENAAFVAIAGAFIVISALKYLFNSYFRIYTKSIIYSAFTLFESLTIPVFVGLTIYKGYGLLNAVRIQLGTLTLIVLVAFIVVISNLGITVPSFKGMKKYFMYSIPLIPTSWFLWVMNSSDRLFISHYWGLKELGVYSLVYNLGYFIVGFIFDSIFLFYSPLVTRLWNEDKKDKAKEMMEYTIKYGLMLSIPTVFVFYVLGPKLLMILSTKDFVHGASVIPLVGLGYMFFMTSAFYETVIGLVEKTKIFPLVFGSCAAFKIVLNLLVIPRMGIIGAAATTAITFCAQILIYAFYSRRFFKFRLCVDSIIKSIIASAVIASCIYFLIPYSSVVTMILLTAAGAVLYFGMLILMKNFSSREMLFFKGLVIGIIKRLG